MIPTIAVLCGVLAIWLAVALWLAATLRLSFHQAVLYVPLKIAYRIDDRQIRAARKAESPIVYVIWHQSHLDPALMLSLLPDDTLHILDQQSAASIWLEPWRALARTIPFNTHHVFVSRRLVRHLRGNGRLAVYMPDDVEPDAKAFRLFRAVARIAAKADAGIVPIFVNGSRYSPLSLSPASAAPRRLLPKLSVKALPAATIAGLREQAGRPPTTASNALFDYFVTPRFTAADLSRSLFLAIRDAADRFGCDRSILNDPASGALTYRQLFVASRIAGKQLAAATGTDEAIGLLLPHSTELMTSLLALQSSGRVAAILDKSTKASHIASAVRTASLKAVLSSRTLIEKAAFGEVVAAIEQAGAKMLWLEDVVRPISRLDKLAAHWLWRRPLTRSGPDKPAAMLFSPTAERVPKATVLSNRNIVANAMQLESRIAISPADRVFSSLPTSRAFGLTGGLVLPLLAGARTFLDPSPPTEDGLSSPWAELQPTILVGSDSLLAAHGSRTGDGNNGHLRTVLSGPEPVSDETRRIWNERFGIEIMTGFGKDEAASLITLNTRTHGRTGSVGRLLPAIEIRLEFSRGALQWQPVDIGPQYRARRHACRCPRHIATAAWRLARQ